MKRSRIFLEGILIKDMTINPKLTAKTSKSYKLKEIKIKSEKIVQNKTGKKKGNGAMENRWDKYKTNSKLNISA